MTRDYIPTDFIKERITELEEEQKIDGDKYPHFYEERIDELCYIIDEWRKQCE